MLCYNKFGDIMNKKYEFQQIERLLENYEKNKRKNTDYTFLNDKQMNNDRKKIIFYLEKNNLIKPKKNNIFLQSSIDEKQNLYNRFAYLYTDEYYYTMLQQKYFEAPNVWHF